MTSFAHIFGGRVPPFAADLSTINFRQNHRTHINLSSGAGARRAIVVATLSLSRVAPRQVTHARAKPSCASEIAGQRACVRVHNARRTVRNDRSLLSTVFRHTANDRRGRKRNERKKKKKPNEKENGRAHACHAHTTRRGGKVTPQRAIAADEQTRVRR